MSDQLIVTLTVGELKAIILESVELALGKISRPVQDETLLKRKDVAKLFHISLVTLHEWMKTGRIPFHRINSRVFFKQSEVMEVLANPVVIGKLRQSNHRTITSHSKAA